MGHVAMDSTRVRANASKHKAMSYGRMKEKETQLEAEMAELLRRAEEVAEEADGLYGRDKRGDELPEELAIRESRLRKIREAKAAPEADAQAAAERAESEGRKHHGVPDDRARRNFTDPDSRIIPGPRERDFQQAYNCQAVVDSAHQVIVAARATNHPSDKQQAVAMVVEAIGNAGVVPKEMSADAGYHSARAVDELRVLGVDSFIAPDQTRHGRVLPPPLRGRILNLPSTRDRMRRKLRTKRGRQRYALRKETVEPVFGQIKQCGASGNSCCGVWARSTTNGRSSAPATTCSSCSAMGPGCSAKRGATAPLGAAGSTILERLSARLHLPPAGIVVADQSRLLRNPG